MIKTKHFMEPVEPDDGPRVWVEPIGLTKDLQKWCSVDEVLPNFGPPRELWDWFAAHPDEYEYFRGRYHECLCRSRHRPALEQLACGAVQGTFTLLHAGEDASRNCATALMDFLIALEPHYSTSD